MTDNTIELKNEDKLNLVLFFMDNFSEISHKYPEITEIKFQNHLIEILKSIDSYTFFDIKKLFEAREKCLQNYQNLSNYIISNFKNKNDNK